MPVINGQKMACEPCIRGHRSTKCTHAGDRLLLPVRKPGRPLSTCPHPPGKACQCRSSVTAAIPRGAACRCGGGSSVKTNGTPTIVKAEPSDNPPLSPAKQASFRIQKPTTKPPRKQSADASALQRMNPSSLNLVNAANVSVTAPGNGASIPDYTSYIPSLQNGNHQYPTYPHINSRLDSAVDSPLMSLNGSLSGPPLMQASGNEVSDSSGTLTPGTSSSPYHTPTSSNGDSLPQEPPFEAAGSCCSQRIRPQPQPQTQVQNHIQFQGQMQTRPQEQTHMMGYAPQVITNNGSIMGQFQQIAANQQMYPISNFGQSALYPETSSYGTPHFPLQQSQWEQLVASLIPQVEPNGNAPGSYTSHVCNCGPDCDCLGCLAHPYNQATCEYIREVMAFQETNVNGKIDSGNSIPDPPLAVSETPPAPAQTPSDTDSPGGNDQNLSPSEFLFVDYGSGMCGCGDDCACVNCMIHRDTIDPKGHQDKTPN
ncbi:uncharacterized protein F4822DRAFT_290487 [Hypoxylon trugodes]|uniref:uncharacterized protein n=1 Tax=Hypoxylon trugodes TaxID=326681 RepID=UPI00218F92D7|nr:uncharacterized protein F4822DRAFT_290487 [Hypoxylon trugodes]KAI1387711.1 hypothetical protein F4822DRAFT_290487 [Hypoxylon trugodes]